MIEQVCSGIYEGCRGLGVGHLVWAPVPHLEEVPRILEVERASPTEHYATKFSIVQIDATHFKNRQKLPVKLLTLGDTEELLISKAKKRPCVILCDSNTEFVDKPVADELKRRKHLRDGSMILAPLYGIATDEEISGFPPIMAARIRAFLYNQFFYLPKTCPKSKISLAKDGIVRLDRLFASTPTRGLDPMDIKIAEEPMLLLLALMRERFRGVKDENLEAVRALLLDALPAEARPQSK